MPEAVPAYLVADIGGTNARFSLARPQGSGFDIDKPSVWLTSVYPGLGEALETFLEQAGRPALAGAAFCAAGPVEGEGDAARIRMTNCPWDVSVEAIATATGLAHPLLFNDFTALALSIPALGADDVRQIGGGAPRAARPIALIGPGTGLGVSGLVPDGAGGFIPLAGEGGHVDLAPSNQREISVLFQLMQEHGHVSAERVLSGPGLETLYGALGALSGSSETANLSAVDIANGARSGRNRLAVETVQLFCGWLGAVAGDLALTLGAFGGVYVGGGIVQRWGDLFNDELFRYRFEAKGRFRSYMAQIPTYVIDRPDPALLGLARAAALADASS